MALPRGTTHCKRGHLREGNINLRTGQCKTCMRQHGISRRATPEGRTERVLEHLKLRGGLSFEELQRAKPPHLRMVSSPL
jgi:hypothetical protein